MRAIAALLLITGLAAGQSSRSTAESRAETTAGGRSRLVVMLVVDQLASEVLRTAWPHLGPDGFKRLAREGAFWPDALYDHACSETGPGHASLSTGASPAMHGIVGNEWIDSSTGVVVGCVDDPDVQAVGGHAGMRGASAHRLLAPTLGEAMEEARLGTRIVTVVDQGPLGDPAGGTDGLRRLVRSKRRTRSSRASRSSRRRLPRRIHSRRSNGSSSLNELPGIEKYAGYLWVKVRTPRGVRRSRTRRRSGRVRSRRLAEVPSRPPPQALRLASGLGRSGLRLAGGARAHVRGGAVPDRAGRPRHATTRPISSAISLSSNDLVGHLYGPESHEVRDITIRTDRMLADFLARPRPNRREGPVARHPERGPRRRARFPRRSRGAASPRAA